MFKFIKTADKSNEYDLSNVEIVVEHNDVTLNELLPIMEEFLQACGYKLAGSLDIVGTDEEE